MRFGVHLPQSGPAATADAIARVAQEAERLGYHDVWVSDHIALPQGAEWPPSSYILEPLMALCWAAAATDRIALGTSVLVLPLRRPALLAKMLGTLDLMSRGRLIVGAAGGWLAAEFDALGVPFDERGPRTDETLEVMRRCWQEDPIDLVTERTGVHMRAMRMKPQPKREIPIWIGGHAEPALRRAILHGDGWHGGYQTPEVTRTLTRRLREERPELSFTLSMRGGWDPQKDKTDDILRDLEGYQEAGIQHVVAEPQQATPDGWLRSTEAFAKLVEQIQ